VRRTKIALALTVVVTALALPGSALPQALIIGTNGQPGDGKHTVAPVSAEQQNGDTSISANAGAGTEAQPPRPHRTATTEGTQSSAASMEQPPRVTPH
jgi:hypothetical protein